MILLPSESLSLADDVVGRLSKYVQISKCLRWMDVLSLGFHIHPRRISDESATNQRRSILFPCDVRVGISQKSSFRSS